LRTSLKIEFVYMNIKELLYKALSIIPLLGVMMGGLCLTSCEETDVVDEYANWKARNVEFIDSIAKVAANDTTGKWLRLLSFKLNETDINGNTAAYSNENYIYCYIKEKGAGIEHPLFTDTVFVDYRGRLIPTASYPEGKIFDQSYKGEFNSATIVPTKFSVGGVIVGWSTALQQMSQGDTWKVYIPANLAYGSSKQTSIPAHSVLIFNMHLSGIYSIGNSMSKN